MAASRAAVRMYRQGLGDCFLITLPKSDGSPWRMLIDCGVILGTSDTQARLGEVIANIAKDVGSTGGRIDVLVITHEHYDHNAAFADDQLAAQFCPDDADAADGKIRVGEVWFAWTEDPVDPLGSKLRKARAAGVNQLAAALAHLPGAAADKLTGAPQGIAGGVAALLSFFGIDPAAPAPEAALSARQPGAAPAAAASGALPHVGATARAMQNARGLGGADGRRLRYCKPGDAPWTSRELPDVRIYVLGPPRDEAMLKKTFAASEVYQLASDGAVSGFFGAAGFPAAATGSAGPAAKGAWFPFDSTYCRKLADPTQGAAVDMPEATADFLQRHYFSTSDDAVDHDQSWRRIDQDWLDSAVQFALNLDSATNNTSLVIAIELAPRGEVLLFPADAQVGNWLSWQTVTWRLGDDTVAADDLLKRTVFYKVGHHGSHNATLREHGLELMPHGLVAMIPVDHAMAVKKHWDGMPLQGLIDALHERDCLVVRMDAELPADHRLRASSEQGSKIDGPLYYEWTLTG